MRMRENPCHGPVRFQPLRGVSQRRSATTLDELARHDGPAAREGARSRGPSQRGFSRANHPKEASDVADRAAPGFEELRERLRFDEIGDDERLGHPADDPSDRHRSPGSG